MVDGLKHRAPLNYWGGVEVKGALVGALVQSIHKERTAAGQATCQPWHFSKRTGADGQRCWRSWKERQRTSEERLTESEAKEFTYRLFKYRLDKRDRAMVASDTKRGLQYQNGTAANK